MPVSRNEVSLIGEPTAYKYFSRERYGFFSLSLQIAFIIFKNGYVGIYIFKSKVLNLNRYNTTAVFNRNMCKQRKKIEIPEPIKRDIPIIIGGHGRE